MKESKLSFAILLSKSISPSEIFHITQTLSFNEIGFFLRKNPFSASQILLLYPKNYENFLLEAEKLSIFKEKHSKRSFSDEFITNLPEGPYSSFVKIRKSLSKNLINLEKSSVFSFENRDKFTKEVDFQQISENLFTSEEFLRIFYSILRKIELKSEKSRFLFDFLEENHQIDDIFPFHDGEKTRNFSRKNENLKDYFGENCAYYFYFLSFMQKWLIIPAIIGTIVVIFNRAFNENVEESPFESLYSVFMVFWSFSFVVFWEKRENSLNYQWHFHSKNENLNKKVAEIDKNDEKHEKFLENDPISGEKILVFSQISRFYRYFQSFLISLPILLLTVLFLIFSLNLRGYVSKDHVYLYMSSISSFSDPNELFDQNSPMANIPVFLHVMVLFLINMLYSSISKWTSEREFHRTVQGEENSLIVKRVIFETFNTFVDLIYLGFIKLDISSVRRELISIYTFDELRRLITETFIPFLARKYKERQRKNRKTKEKCDIPEENTEEMIEKKLVEISLNKYEGFDDYLEIVINFAYITLFASAFPLAPLLILIFHYLESLSDRYKLMNIYQRPLPETANGIGSWLGVLRIISILSVLSNIVLFAFSSEKMSQIFPFLFKIYHVHVRGKVFEVKEERHLLEADVKGGMGRYVILIVFVIEHVCFIGFWMIKKWADSREDWTDVYRKRKEFKMKLNKIKGFFNFLSFLHFLRFLRFLRFLHF